MLFPHFFNSQHIFHLLARAPSRGSLALGNLGMVPASQYIWMDSVGVLGAPSIPEPLEEEEEFILQSGRAGGCGGG